ncbi:MAG: helix-turn-helix domain-containing protein [Algicola sp.]|nr:helix-turn-helix domain-containing protein [Algicola sp.]
MKGIVLQNIDTNKFLELLEVVNELSNDVKLLIDKENKEKITPEEAAKEWNCSKQTIYAKIKDGTIKASKNGRKILIVRSDLNKALTEVKSLKYKRS